MTILGVAGGELTLSAHPAELGGKTLWKFELSAVSNDFPSIMGVTFVIALMYIFVNLIVDLLYAVLDPQIRYA